MNRYLLAVIVVLAVLYGWRIVSAQEPTYYVVSCADGDVNSNGHCNATDAIILMQNAFYNPEWQGVESPTWTATSTTTATSSPSPDTPTAQPSATPSPTPTDTPSVTATSTATTTPTRTPTPSNTSAPPTITPTPTVIAGFNVQTLINDSDNTCTNGSHVYCTGGASPLYPNQGSLCEPPASYDWGIAGKGLGNGAPTGDQVTGWWTAQWQLCGDSAPGSVIITNFHFVGFTGSSWVNMGGRPEDWCYVFGPTTTGSTYGACTGMPFPRMVEGQRALHGSTNRQPDQDVLCLAVYYLARSDSSKPVMMNAGADHISGGNIIGDKFISRYRVLNLMNQTQVGGSSCTAQTLLNNPPPGM